MSRDEPASSEGSGSKGNMDSFVSNDSFSKLIAPATLRFTVEVNNEVFEYQLSDQCIAIHLMASRLWDVVQSKRTTRDLRKAKRRSGTTGSLNKERSLTPSSSSASSSSSSKSSSSKSKRKQKSSKKDKLGSPTLSPTASPVSSPRLLPLKGTPLAKYMKNQRLEYPKETIPLFVRHIINVIMLRGLAETNLFASASSKVENEAKFILEAVEMNLWETIQPSHVCCLPHVLQVYLRDMLPEPLISQSFKDTFLAIAKMGKDSWPIHLRKCVQSLPVDNRKLLGEIMFVLHMLYLNRKVNQLSVDRISHSLGPAFMWSAEETPTDLDALLKARDETVNINKTIAALIENQPFVFDEDLTTATILSPAEKENLASRYPELGALLMEPGLSLIQGLSKTMEPNTATTFATDVVHVFHENGNGTALVLNLVEREIENCDTRSTLFRENTLATHCMTYFCRLEGLGYLKSLLGPIIQDLADSGVMIEVDPGKVANQSAIEANQATLLKYLTRILDDFASSLNDLPLSFRQVLKKLQAKSVEKWGEDCGRHAVVGSLLFLRLICPALISPEGWEITDKITRETRRGLILMSKVIQALANGTKTKEAFLQFAHEWMDASLDSFRASLDEAARTDADAAPLQDMDATKVNVDFGGMARLHSYLHENLISIDEVVRTLSAEAQATFKKVMLLLVDLPPPPPLQSLESTSSYLSSVAPLFSRRFVQYPNSEDVEHSPLVAATSSSDGLELFTIANDGYLCSYDLRDTVPLETLSTKLDGTCFLARIEGTARYLMMGGSYGLAVWDQNKNAIASMHHTEKKFLGMLLLSGSDTLNVKDQTIGLIGWTEDELLFLTKSEVVHSIALQTQPSVVQVIGSRVWCGTNNGKLLVTDSDCLSFEHTLDHGSSRISSIASINQTVWTCAQGSSEILVWELESMTVKQTLNAGDHDGHSNVNQVLVECGSYLWALGHKQLNVWDLGGHLRLTSFSCIDAPVVSVCRAWCSTQQKWAVWVVASDGSVSVYHVPQTCGIKRPIGNQGETSVVEQKVKREQKARRGHRRSQSMDMLPSVASASLAGTSSRFSAASPVVARKTTSTAQDTASSPQEVMIVRPMIADTPFMRQLGLNKTLKTLRITSETTTREMESMMVKQMIRGMTPVQIEQLQVECEVYHLAEVIGHKTRPLDSTEFPLDVQKLAEKRKLKDWKFVFQPTKARISGPSKVTKK